MVHIKKDVKLYRIVYQGYKIKKLNQYNQSSKEVEKKADDTAWTFILHTNKLS